jgi:glycosyltransferase involved in cell wall biosynthesis
MGIDILVSVCIIIRDEESNLKRALSSIPNSFKKAVVDTGSIDKEPEIWRSKLNGLLQRTLLIRFGP